MEITKVKINEKEYSAQLNFGAIKMLQKRTGLAIDKVFEGVSDMNFELVSEILFCCIYPFNPKFKMDEIDSMSYENMIEAINGIKEIIENSMPKSKGEKKQ